MKRSEIEPGLVPTFRAFIGLQLVLLLLLSYSDVLPARLRLGVLGLRLRVGVLRPGSQGVDLPALVLVLVGLIVLSLLLAYLSTPSLARRLTWAYLPLALGLDVLVLLLGVHLLSRGQAAATGTSGLVVRSWQLFLLLFVPLILTAWQYSFMIVVLSCAGVGLLDLLLTLPWIRAGASGAWMYALLLIFRTSAFLLVGYLITRVLQIQRGLRHELAEANARLVRYAADLEELATSRERNRLARELHDTLAHALSGLAVQLEAAVTQWDSHPPEAKRRVEMALASAREGLMEARRAIKNLRASVLEERGLRGALQALAEDAAEKAGIDLDLRLPSAAPRLSPAVEQGMYRIAEEALFNAIQHADPKHLIVHLTGQAGRVELVVEDDGRGGAPTHAVAEGHFGVQGMRERAELIGGDLVIGPAAGGGTRVRLSVKEDA